MLKKRLIATLIVREGIVVQSLGFRSYLPVGRPEIAIEFLNSWGIDEIVLLDISASKDKAKKRYDFIHNISRSCYVPLTVGGGIDCIEDIRQLLYLGADKICINSHCLLRPDFIKEAAQIFGNQCIVVSMDVIGSYGDYRVYDAARGTITEYRPLDWAREVEAQGAGEIYLTSVARDGSKSGFEIPLIQVVSAGVNIPVIASGGAGHAGHLLEVLTHTNASAASAANLFHFSEHAVITAKAILHRNQVGIRLNTHADYSASAFDDSFRLEKHHEDLLENLLFEKIEKEII